VPEITDVVTNNPNATVTSITQATAIPGTASVLVTAENGTDTETYIVVFNFEGPTTAAPTPPARNPAGVFAIYSDAYANQPDVVFGAFDVGTQDITDVEIVPGDNILRAVTTAAPGRNFLFADWGAPIDLSSMTNYHVDYWIETEFTTGLVMDHKFSNHVGDNGETSAFSATPGVDTFGEWVSIDIPISAMANGDASQLRNALRQYVLTVAGAQLDTRIVYFDNIYLYNDALSTNEFNLESVSVSPNPTNTNWTVKTNNGQNITGIEVYDILGKRVLQVVPNASEFAINASELNDGIYLAKIISDNGSTTIKLVKN
jgi:endoglucanase